MTNQQSYLVFGLNCFCFHSFRTHSTFSIFHLHKCNASTQYPSIHQQIHTISLLCLFPCGNESTIDAQIYAIFVTIFTWNKIKICAWQPPAKWKSFSFVFLFENSRIVGIRISLSYDFLTLAFFACKYRYRLIISAEWMTDLE